MPRLIHCEKIKNGTPEGKAEVYDSNARLIQLGVFSNGKLNGVGCTEVKYNVDFQVTSYYVGAMEFGKYHGQGTLYEGVFLKQGTFDRGIFKGVVQPTAKTFTLVTIGFGSNKNAVGITED